MAGVVTATILQLTPATGDKLVGSCVWDRTAMCSLLPTTLLPPLCRLG